MKPTITMKTLSKLALSMNEVMGLDPEIDPNDYEDVGELQAAILEETKDENGECQIYQSDYLAGKTEDKEGEAKFSKNAWAMLKALDVEPVEEESEPPSEPEKKTPEKKDKKTAPKKKKTAPKKKKTAPKKKKTAEKETAEKETAEKETAEKETAEKETAEKKTPAKKDEPKKKKKVRYTRFDSFATAIKSGIKNVEKLTEKANDLYVKQGGKDNVKESKWAVNVSIQILVKLEIATIEKGMLKTDF